MKQILKKKSQAFIEDIARYEKALSTVRSISNNDVNRNEDEVSELAWLLWKSDKFEQRAKDIAKEDANDFTMMSNAINDIMEASNAAKNKEVDTSTLPPAQQVLVGKINEKIKKDNEILDKNVAFLKDLQDVIGMFAKEEQPMLPLFRAVIS